MRLFVHGPRNCFRKAWRVVPLVIIAGVWTPAIAEFPGSADPVLIVDTLHEALTETASRGELLNYESRFRELEPLITSSHDFVTIGRLVGGRFWRKLNEKQRSSFVDSFRRVSVAVYASRFATAEGVRFEAAILDQQSGGRARVRSELIRTDGSRITFDYTLQQTNDLWRIVTVIVDGVSDLALRRAELSKIFDDSGFEGVMENLEAKVAEAAAGG